MRHRCFLFVFVVCALVHPDPFLAAERLTGPSEGVEMRSFYGRPGALRLFSEDTGISAVITPSFGGRVMFYGIEAEEFALDSSPTRRRQRAGSRRFSAGYRTGTAGHSGRVPFSG